MTFKRVSLQWQLFSESVAILHDFPDLGVVFPSSPWGLVWIKPHLRRNTALVSVRWTLEFAEHLELKPWMKEEHLKRFIRRWFKALYFSYDWIYHVFMHFRLFNWTGWSRMKIKVISADIGMFQCFQNLNLEQTTHRSMLPSVESLKHSFLLVSFIYSYTDNWKV